MPHDHAKRIVEFINRIIESSSLDLRASVLPDGDGFKIDVRGEDVALLLGHNAELLDALEYLGNRLLAQEASEESRITFDSDNYRVRREKELRLMAAHGAEKVRISRVPFSFDPMNPNERRIIHLSLAEDATVKTESRGTGPDRKVTIYPA
ncbi:MAG: hypothetical protein L0229_21650 [Blastocatellia bacterium]|nr:hypothetical protein [Blastocatellia bacterium]